MMSFNEMMRRVESDPKLRIARARAGAARKISALLARIRKEAGLTQAQIAARLGVSQARISQVESGLIDHTPSVDFAFVYAAACGRTIELSAAPLEGAAYLPEGPAEAAAAELADPIGAAVAATAPELSDTEARHVEEDITRLVEAARTAHAEEETDSGTVAPPAGETSG